MKQDQEIEDMLDMVAKRFQTTMIGALAKFEESFGYLWEDNSESSRAYHKLWQQTRNNVLNNGNHQLRTALDELSDFLYDRKSKYKYHYKFYFNNNRPQDRGE